MRLRSAATVGFSFALLIAACGGDEALVSKSNTGGAAGAGAGGKAGANAAGAAGTNGTAGNASAGSTGTGGTSGGSTAGNAGSTGIAGSTGTAGAAGKDGTAGAAGANGIAGTTGTAGTNGTAGTAGNNGTAGTAGNNGTAGTAGNNGTAGTAGAGGAPAKVCTPACSGGYQCVDGTCVLGSSCGREDITVTRTPPNVLLTLDRSCSMTAKVGGVAKWTSAVNAMTSFTKKFDKDVRFGLELFPDTDDGNDCTMADPFQVAIGANKAAAIGTLLNAAKDTKNKYYPNGPCTTPINHAMALAAAAPALKDGVHAGFAVLITDGAQACGGANADKETTATITAMKAAGVGTFVVSFGSGEGIDEVQLSAWADLGGYPNTASGNPKIRFYQAESETQLDAALSTIAEAAVSCDFKLAKTPPDLDKLYVFEDLTDQVARDPKHLKGWDYDAAKNSVTLYGQNCSDLKKGITKEVNVVYGCPGNGGGGAGGSGGGLGNCETGKPKCDKDNLCPPDAGQSGTCTQGCCTYGKD